MIAKYITPGDVIELPTGDHVTVDSKNDYIHGTQLREEFRYEGGLWDCPGDYEVRVIALSPHGLGQA